MANQNLGVDNFKAKLTGGGARANMFQATLNFPSFAGGNSELTSFMCKGASIPASIISPIEVNFRGRKLFVAGDRTFEPWTVTIINDAGFEIRDSFEKWMNGINGHIDNSGLNNPTEYQADMLVAQLDKEGTVTKEYTFRGCWPTNVAAIDLNYDSADTIEEFTVEFQIDYWESNTTS